MKLAMDLGARSYDIIVKRGALKNAGMLANLGGKVLVLTDDGVPAKLVKTFMAQCANAVLLSLPKGEQSKQIASWQTAALCLLENAFGPQDSVAALGGGMVGDVAGFTAATYMRGISFLQFPTTTMAQVDSSIGGKCALNLHGEKNVIGTVYQPSIVVADPDVLQSLPPRHFANGLAEALKIGLLFSRELFELLENEPIKENLEKMIYLSLLYKKNVVERDELATGERRLLNFGHTIGHAIEAACGLDGLLHGECVALGMLPMIESKTLQRRTKAIMRKLGLPLAYPCDDEAILLHMMHDKKRSGSNFTVAKVKKLGHGTLESISYDELCLLATGKDAPL